MKKIGFADYYMSEWHANNYPAWMKEANAQLGLDYELAYAWAEEDVSPRDGVTTDQWCAQNGAQRCGTLEELCEKSDVIVILAPSNPEKHLQYAQVVLPYGKPTYIDKSFAPDYETACKIFALAEPAKTPFFSSSALRYATELAQCPDCREIMTTGSGRSVDEYIIHQAEMVVVKLGAGAAEIRAEQAGNAAYTFHVRYPDDRRATMTYAKNALPFTLWMSDGAEQAVYTPVNSEFFKLLIRDMLRFFNEGTVSFDPAQTLEVMKLRKGAVRAEANPGEWLAL